MGLGVRSQRDLRGRGLVGNPAYVAAQAAQVDAQVGCRDRHAAHRIGSTVEVVPPVSAPLAALLLGASLNAEIEKKWPTRETLRRSPAPRREE